MQDTACRTLLKVFHAIWAKILHSITARNDVYYVDAAASGQNQTGKAGLKTLLEKAGKKLRNRTALAEQTNVKRLLAAMVKYPQDFPTDAARIVVENFRNGTIPENKVAVAEAVWNIQGYAFHATLGDSGLARTTAGAPKGLEFRPEDLHPDNFQSKPVDNEAVICELEKLATASPTATDAEAKMTAFPIPWGTILRWTIQFAIQILGGLV